MDYGCPRIPTDSGDGRYVTAMPSLPTINAISPERLSAAERLDEIAEILAAGLMRLRVRQSSDESADYGESSLHSVANQSGHAEALSARGGSE